MPPQGLTILDLQVCINKYCELSPDVYARAHYDAMLAERDTQWDIAPASWDWLYQRLRADYEYQPVKHLIDSGDDESPWWLSWENS
jgi:hypothetical protein